MGAAAGKYNPKRVSNGVTGLRDARRLLTIQPSHITAIQDGAVRRTGGPRQQRRERN